MWFTKTLTYLEQSGVYMPNIMFRMVIKKIYWISFDKMYKEYSANNKYIYFIIHLSEVTHILNHRDV